MRDGGRPGRSVFYAHSGSRSRVSVERDSTEAATVETRSDRMVDARWYRSVPRPGTTVLPSIIVAILPIPHRHAARRDETSEEYTQCSIFFVYVCVPVSEPYPSADGSIQRSFCTTDDGRCAFPRRDGFSARPSGHHPVDTRPGRRSPASPTPGPGPRRPEFRFSWLFPIF